MTAAPVIGGSPIRGRTGSPSPHASQRRPGDHLVSAAAARVRRLPSRGKLARRRFMLGAMKLVLPTTALGLLTTLVLWPEIDRTGEQERLAFRRMAGAINGATLTDARYRSVDERGRPYTVTATKATQVDQQRINLVTPKGDITLQNGTWLLVESKQGVFMQGVNQLDLSKDVVLYRDDGTTMRTQSTAVDLKAGVAVGNEYVRAEGPFGTLDAQGGFTLTDKGAVVVFAGPARLVTNAHEQ
jgi:lipopolysaccharide export system protein LptC